MPVKQIIKIVFAFVIVVNLSSIALAVRIKDITDIKGVRRNQLIGYGLVVGLDGTGDGKKSVFTIRSMSTMLEKMGVAVKPGEIKAGNAAAVMVTADLPPFARSGGRIDALVSSIGDAKNLQGGTLIFTPLKASNGKIYAVAQGPVSTGGFSAEGTGGSVRKNFPTVGRIADGALIEREVNADFAPGGVLSLILHSPDFTTASRIAESINSELRGRVANTPDPGTIEISVPANYRNNVVQFVTIIEAIDVSPDAAAKVIINERTGTIVMGENVRISTVAVAHGSLSIEIRESADVSQPEPFSRGDTVVVPETDIFVTEGENRLLLMQSGTRIGEVVRALNALGVSPRDLIAIFQAIKASGALRAKLEII